MGTKHPLAKLARKINNKDYSHDIHSAIIIARFKDEKGTETVLQGDNWFISELIISLIKTLAREAGIEPERMLMHIAGEMTGHNETIEVLLSEVIKRGKEHEQKSHDKKSKSE